MANSLLIAGLETVGFVTNPQYHLGKTDGGQDFGEILPDTDVISSLLLDGDVITGERTGNRTWNLTVVVTGVSRTDLSANIDAFCSAVNTDTFPVVWTPDGCPSTTFTAYRATFSSAKDFAANGQLVGEIDLTFQTNPFGQSSGAQSFTVAPTGSASSIQLDGMNSGTISTGATLVTSPVYEGSHAITVGLTLSGKQYTTGTNIPARTIPSVNISAMGAISLRVSTDGTPGYVTPDLGTLHFTLVLTSASGASAYTTKIDTNAGNGFVLSAINLTDGTIYTYGTPAVDLTAVTGWKIFANTSSRTSAFNDPSSYGFHIDDLRAFPPGSVSNATAEGSVVLVPALIGSARTPVSLVATGTALGNLLLHSPPATQDPDTAIFIGLASGVEAIPNTAGDYDDTFSLVGFLTATDTINRTLTATVQQLNGMTVVSTRTLNLAVTGAQTIVSFGEVTLPLVNVPAESTSSSFVITLGSASTNDVFSDVALCSTSGQTVLVTGLPAGTTAVYVDTPDPTVGVGQIYASATDRTAATSVMGLALISGGPILFEPGNNRLLTASTSGAPTIAGSYSPSWLDEAQQ